MPPAKRIVAYVLGAAGAVVLLLAAVDPPLAPWLTGPLRVGVAILGFGAAVTGHVWYSVETGRISGVYDVATRALSLVGFLARIQVTLPTALPDPARLPLAAAGAVLLIATFWLRRRHEERDYDERRLAIRHRAANNGFWVTVAVLLVTLFASYAVSSTTTGVPVVDPLAVVTVAGPALVAGGAVFFLSEGWYASRM